MSTITLLIDDLSFDLSFCIFENISAGQLQCTCTCRKKISQNFPFCLLSISNNKRHFVVKGIFIDMLNKNSAVVITVS